MSRDAVLKEGLLCLLLITSSPFEGEGGRRCRTGVVRNEGKKKDSKFSPRKRGERLSRGKGKFSAYARKLSGLPNVIGSLDDAVKAERETDSGESQLREPRGT